MNPSRLSPCAGDVPGRFEDRRCATGERVERAEATGSVERDREPSIGRPQPQHRGVEAGPANGSRLDELVVTARHERARAEGVGAEQVEEHVGRRRDVPERHLCRRLSRHPLDGVARAVVGEEAGGYRAGDVAFPQGAQLAGLGHLADDGAMQLPAVDHGLHLGETVGRDDRHHALLRLGDHDLPRLHPVLALRDVVEMDVDAVVGGHLRERGGEPRGATILEREHEPALDELDGHLDQALARERVTDLDGGPLVGRLVAELLAREHRGTADPVPAGGGAEEDEERARRVGPGAHHRVGREQADAHRIDEAVGCIDVVEHDLAADVRNADGVAVRADAADGPGEVVVRSSEAQPVEKRDRPRAHRDDVAEDAADPGRGALERLDRGRVVVALRLEGDGEPVTEVEHAGVLTGALQHPRAARRQALQEQRRVLVAAVLRPEQREHGQLEMVRLPLQQLLDADVLPVREAELAVEWLFRDEAQDASLARPPDDPRHQAGRLPHIRATSGD